MSGRPCPLSLARLATVAVVVVAAVGLVGPSLPMPAAAAAEPLSYQAPVATEPVDAFRPPASPYGAGNRGVDYATDPGGPVAAAAPGVVAFAGQVGGSLHVTVLHPDGIRTTYSFLASVTVRRGDPVAAGQEVGRSGDRLHWGARAGDAYVNPMLLLGDSDGVTRAKLVPEGGGDRAPRSEAEERSLVAGLLRTVVRAGAAVARATPGAVPWARDRPLQQLLNDIGHWAARDPVVGAWVDAAGQLATADWVTVVTELRDAAAVDEPCTPGSVPPPRPTGRRLAVLVGGLGSSSDSAAVTRVDTAALGYARGDVHQFSYRGGTADKNPYSSRDTHGDIPAAGDRLRRLLDDLATARPGVPIDVIAHSQGGIVTRLALAHGAPPGVASVVTLGSPHQGADLAQVAVENRRSLEGQTVQSLARTTGVSPIAGSAPALQQLAQGSSMLAELDRLPPPAGLHLVSVAARADLVVPPPRSRAPGWRTVTVTPDGLHHHDSLPGSAAAAREIRLAAAGLPPTCRSRRDSVLDAIAARLIVVAEQGPRVALAARGHPPLRRN